MRTQTHLITRAQRELALMKHPALRQPIAGGVGAQPKQWDLDAILLRLSPLDLWTLRDAFEGVMVFGGIGSGKTNGSGRVIRQAMLRHGFGGLVLTAKPNEVENWQADCAACDRASDVVIFSPESGLRFNMFEHELTRVGPGSGYTRNIIEIVGAAFDSSQSDVGDSTSDPHWRQARDYLLGHTIDLCALATGGVSVPALLEIVRTAPTSLATFESASWQATSPFFAKVKAARGNALLHDQFETFKRTVQYFCEFASWDDRYRGSVVAMFTTAADLLTRDPFDRMFSGASTTKPQDTFEGKIVILDMPVSQYRAVGRSAQALAKTAWQMEVLRRKGVPGTRPVFLYADEAQNFITNFDAVFQNQAREARAATVYLTQNISNVTNAMRGQGGAEAAKSLIANLQTKVFHANGHHETNKWAEQLIGDELRAFAGSSRTWSCPGESVTRSVSEQYTQKVRADEFTALRTGGDANGGYIDAIVFQAGRPWNATRSNYLNVVFKQTLQSQ